MSDDTIKIKKQDLWKYSTVLLLAVLVVVLIVSFTGTSNGNGNVIQDAGSNNQPAATDLSVFEDTDLFPSIGPENSGNVVIEFSDFQCPYCAMASGIPSWTNEYATQYGSLIGVSEDVKKMAEDGELKLIYVSMSFQGPESVYAAQAGLCANRQGLFWEMREEIFAASTAPTQNTGKYEKDNLKVIASSIPGLDTASFNSCLDNDETLGDVQLAAQYASTAATGTPTFYVNGQRVSSSKSAIQAALN